MELFKIRKTGRRIPLIVGVDQDGKLILSEEQGVDEVLLDKRPVQEETES